MASPWVVVYTTEFLAWRETLNARSRRSIEWKLELLRSEGPALGRPHVDHVKGSRHPNLKELRVNSETAIRIFFCFDSRRQAVLLIGGSKSSHREWYKKMIQQADRIMDTYVVKEGM